MSKQVVSFDYSMSNPCMCVLGKDDLSFKYAKFYFLTNRKRDTMFPGPVGNIYSEIHKPWHKPMERFSNIASFFIKTLENLDLQCGLKGFDFYMEGYSMNSQGTVFDIAENTGILKYKLWQGGVDVNLIPPAVIKKYATGKGNADKTKMYQAFLARGDTPELMSVFYDKADGLVKSPVSDIVDAYYIALLGHSMSHVSPP